MPIADQQQKLQEYQDVFNAEQQAERIGSSQDATNNFYDLITEFYERGWGTSFHFAARHKGESFEESILRHEHYLSDKLGLTADDKVLDAGCGVMGPARNIATYSGAHVTGISINQHQINRCNELNSETDIPHLLTAVQGDFMDLPFPDEHFTKAYAIEALCHSPSMLGVYQQIYKKLKPGGKACFYQWVMTDKYDPTNAAHKKAKEMIEYGNGITNMNTRAEVDQALKNSGFEVLETEDLAASETHPNDVPWYATLQAGWSLKQIRHTAASRTAMSYLLRTLERLSFVKKGVSETQRILLVAADGLVAGGKEDIFTPMYMVTVQKPVE